MTSTERVIWKLCFHQSSTDLMPVPSKCLCFLCSYIYPLHTIVSQRCGLFPLPLGDPTPYLFIFNHQLYVELTFRSVPYALPLPAPGLQIHTLDSLLDTHIWMSNKHLKFNKFQCTLKITPQKTKGHNWVRALLPSYLDKIVLLLSLNLNASVSP